MQNEQALRSKPAKNCKWNYEVLLSGAYFYMGLLYWHFIMTT